VNSQLEEAMRDRDTVIRAPHDDDDPRHSVAMQEEGATVTLFFEPDGAFWSGDGQLLEIRLLPSSGGEFEPWRLLPNLPLYLRYARARAAWKHGDAAAALRALRQVSSTRRGFSDDYLRIVTELYELLVTEGEKYPIKTLAKTQQVDVSTASRWVSAARNRGFLDSPKGGKS
jgi:hypothetical protein